MQAGLCEGRGKKGNRFAGLRPRPRPAVLEDGRTITYLTAPIGEGATKEVYPTADRSGVVCFYKDAALGRDFEWLARLRAVIAEYNPTAASPGRASTRIWRSIANRNSSTTKRSGSAMSSMTGSSMRR